MAVYQVINTATDEVINRIVAEETFIETLRATSENMRYILEVNEIDVRAEIDRKIATEVDALATNPILWASLTAEQQGLLIQYRAALAAVPEQEGFPHEVIWPEKPEV